MVDGYAITAQQDMQTAVAERTALMRQFTKLLAKPTIRSLLHTRRNWATITKGLIMTTTSEFGVTSGVDNLGIEKKSSTFSLRDCLNADWKRLHVYRGHSDRPKRFIDHFSPKFVPIVLIRLAYWFYLRRLHRLAKFMSLINFIVFGLEVPTRLKIGEGLVIPHTQGTIIGAGFVGRNVTIFQQVTLGAKLADFDYDFSQRPHICDDVTITAGAKIIGPVHLGSGCTIGANAVVISDIEEGALAVGIPARVVKCNPTTAE